jgi:hypothetical protein
VDGGISQSHAAVQPREILLSEAVTGLVDTASALLNTGWLAEATDLALACPTMCSDYEGRRFLNNNDMDVYEITRRQNRRLIHILAGTGKFSIFSLFLLFLFLRFSLCLFVFHFQKHIEQ